MTFQTEKIKTHRIVELNKLLRYFYTEVNHEVCKHSRLTPTLNDKTNAYATYIYIDKEEGPRQALLPEAGPGPSVPGRRLSATWKSSVYGVCSCLYLHLHLHLHPHSPPTTPSPKAPTATRRR